jgi:hypothetical protein
MSSRNALLFIFKETRLSFQILPGFLSIRHRTMAPVDGRKAKNDGDYRK